MLERPGIYGAVLRLILDVALTLSALFLAGTIRPLLPFGRPLAAEQVGLSPSLYVFVAIIWAATFLLLGIYEPRNQRAAEEAQAIFVATSLATLVLAALLYFTFRQISRLQFCTFYALDLAFLIGARLAIRRGLRLAGLPRYTRRRVLVLGAGETGQDAIRMVESHRWAGLEPVGFLDDDVLPHTEIDGYPVLGGTEQVAEYLSSEAIDEVIVALPLESYTGFFRLLGSLQQLPARVRIVPDY
ncbi:MAG: nucleoside-diphosphate sugar epimerase/dehydratase, partial [Anaerolineae bacterium]